MKTVQVHTLKPCELHIYNPEGVGKEAPPGEYDGKTKPEMSGSWAFMCRACLELFGYPNSEGLTFKLEAKA